MFKKIDRYLQYMKRTQHVNIALSRGLASASLRQVDLTNPDSWEFSGFSQNGEDGIIDVLLKHLRLRNRYFIEIGASDGLENNTTWLAMVKRYGGQWIEGGMHNSKWCDYIFGSLNYGVQSVCEFITLENIHSIKDRSPFSDPDLFSLDIDGNDLYIAEAILRSGMRPKIFVVEYNAVYGPENEMSIPYDPNFFAKSRAPDNLYYGCSVASMKRLFAGFGYHFVTVESNGVNAFFVDPEVFEPEFLHNVRGAEYRENFSNRREYNLAWNEQLKLIASRQFYYPAR